MNTRVDDIRAEAATKHLTAEEQGWLEGSKAIVRSLMAIRRATGTLPTSMEEEQTNLERALYRLAEARETLAAALPLLRRLRTAHEPKMGVCTTCCVSWPCMDSVDVDRILKGGA